MSVNEIAMATNYRFDRTARSALRAMGTGSKLMPNQCRRREGELPAGIDQPQAKIRFLEVIGEGLVKAADCFQCGPSERTVGTEQRRK